MALDLLGEILLAEGGETARLLLNLLPFAAIAVLFYVMLIKPERSKQSAQRQMLANIKKNDRVITVGGIRGIVTNVHRDNDEVTVNVDESSGTKIRFTVASIARVDTPEGKSDVKKK